ncbi:hypothetical protein ZWY2020_007581 [Hordeum vulgare]|nr:hypothetical protein ZWY2020_007581 [Hordeum vulgare]
MPFGGKQSFPVQRGRDKPTPGSGGGVGGRFRSPASFGDSGEVSPRARRPAGTGDASPGGRRPVGGEAESPGAGSGAGRDRTRARKKPCHPYPAQGKDPSVDRGRRNSTPGGGGAARAPAAVYDSDLVIPEARSQFEGEEGYPSAAKLRRSEALKRRWATFSGKRKTLLQPIPAVSTPRGQLGLEPAHRCRAGAAATSLQVTAGDAGSAPEGR